MPVGIAVDTAADDVTTRPHEPRNAVAEEAVRERRS